MDASLFLGFLTAALQKVAFCLYSLKGYLISGWSVNRPVRYAVIVQAIKNDLCLFEVCQRILEESELLRRTSSLGDYVARIYIFIPDTRWDGKPANLEDKAEIETICVQLNTWFQASYGSSAAVVQSVPFKLTAVANVHQSRILVETDCRNWYQRHCRSNGYNHCIILDGDELWKRGLLAQLNKVVRRRRPWFVYTGMLPVVGLPGYPIDGSIEMATIYAYAKMRFRYCRSTYGFRLGIAGEQIYHFSLVRKSTNEIIDKLLNSAHADEPKYLMTEWIRDILLPGKIRPGLKNVNMKSRQPVNVWPVVRTWTNMEWPEMPASIRAYLASPDEK